MDDILNKQRSQQTSDEFGELVRTLKKSAMSPAGIFSVGASLQMRGKVNPDGVDKELHQSNKLLKEISGTLMRTFAMITRGVVGLAAVEIRQNNIAARQLAPEDRAGALDVVENTKSYKTYGQTVSENLKGSLGGIKDTFTTKRGLSDMVMGAPEKGSARAAGREYKDALDQKIKDRMMLEGPHLTKMAGSEKAAKAQLAKDFAEEQKLNREIKKTSAEIKRRQDLGWTTIDDKVHGGDLISKLANLLDRYARVDPTNVGRDLGLQLDPATVKELEKKQSEIRFKANTTVPRGGDEIAQLVAAGKLKPQTPLKPTGKSEEQQTEDGLKNTKQEEQQEKQISILERIASALNIQNKKKAEEKPKEDDKSFIDDVLDSVRSIGPMIAGLIPRVMAMAGPAAAVVGAGAVGVAAGSAINKYWEAGTGNTIGSSLYNVFGQSEAEKNINKPVSQAEIDRFRFAKSIKKDPATAALFPVTPTATTVPNDTTVALKPVSNDTGNKLEKSTTANETLKKEAATKATESAAILNAPITVNNSTPSSSQSTFTVRNQESTIGEYIKTRYTR